MTPTLDYDILILIVSFCDRDTVWAIMETNRLLRQEGAKILLRSPVILRTDLNTMSFINFLTAAQHTCSHLLRSLTLSIYEPRRTTAALLADCLQYMTGLRSLTLKHVEFLLEGHPTLLHAFTQLESLEHLDIPHAGEHAVELLRNTRSRLRTVRLRPAVEEESNPCPLDMLAHVSTSLEALTCELWHHAHPPESEPYPVFPHMRRLKVEIVDSPVTARYAAALPNLTHLSVRSRESNEFMPNDMLYKIRHKNITSASSTSSTWRTLEEFSGDIADAYILGLHQCRVKRLHVGRLYRKELPLLEDVLSDMRPTELAAWAPYPDYVRCRGDPSMSGLIDALRTSPGAAGLKVFELGIDVEHKVDMHELKELFDDLLDAIRPRSIERFVWRYAASSVDDPSMSVKIEFAHHVFTQVPSLNTMVFKRVEDLENGEELEVIPVCRAM